MKKTLSIAKMLVAFISVIAMVLIVNTVQVRAYSGETVRVSNAKEMQAAIKQKDVGTIIFRTEAQISITIKSADAAKNIELIVDAPFATVTNKAVFRRINIQSVNEFFEKASGNDIYLSKTADGKSLHLTVAAKKKVKKLTIFDTYGYFYGDYTLRKGAKIKAMELVYAGDVLPVKSSGSISKKKLTIDFTNTYENTCSQVIKFDASGRMTGVNCDSDGVEFAYDYTFSYDKNGNAIEAAGWDNDNGHFTTKYIYSDNVQQKVVYDGEWSSYETNYTYDKKGRLSKIESSQEESIDSNDFVITWSYNYKYDKKGRLINETYAELTHYLNGSYEDSTSSSETTYTYNSKGMLTASQTVAKYGSEDYSYSYENEYDKAGNLIKQTITHLDYDTQKPVTYVYEYTYDELGEIMF